MYNNPLYKLLKKQFKSVLHGIGYEVESYNIHTSEEVLLKTILQNFNIRTILDVGANEGQFAHKLIELDFDGKIFSFEPIEAVFQTLQKNASPFPNWTPVHMGVGRQPGEHIINVSENLASSSLYAVNNESVSVDPTTRTSRQESIKVTTIDTFMRENGPLEKELLLKLDIQGYELEALHGALENLSQFKLIQAELSFTKVYEGAPLYNEVIAFMERYGFEIFTFIPAFIDSKTGRMLQADGIFARKN